MLVHKLGLNEHELGLLVQMNISMNIFMNMYWVWTFVLTFSTENDKILVQNIKILFTY